MQVVEGNTQTSKPPGLAARKALTAIVHRHHSSFTGHHTTLVSCVQETNASSSTRCLDFRISQRLRPRTVFQYSRSLCATNVASMLEAKTCQQIIIDFAYGCAGATCSRPFCNRQLSFLSRGAAVPPWQKHCQVAKSSCVASIEPLAITAIATESETTNACFTNCVPCACA